MGLLVSFFFSLKARLVKCMGQQEVSKKDTNLASDVWASELITFPSWKEGVRKKANGVTVID